VRILQVVPYFYPAWAYGGPPRAVYEISKELVARGHIVTVYTTDVYDRDNRLGEKTNELVDIDGVQAYYFKNLSNRLAYSQMFIPPRLIPVMSKHIVNYDIVHLNCCYNLLNVIAHHYARKHNVPLVLNARGTLDPARRRLKSTSKKTYMCLFGHKILGDLDKAIALSEAEVEQYLQMGVDEDKIRIIPNGVHLSEFRDLPARGVFRKNHSLKSRDRIILFLGRIHRIKGLDLLVAAFLNLRQELDSTKLVIVGPDEDQVYLRNIARTIAIHGAEEDVLFTGLLSGTEKLSAYVDADVLVLPSYAEGFPMTVLEACAIGTPVVVTDRCYVPEVADYGAGFVIQPNEVELRGALLRILTDDGLRLTLGSNGKRMVQERFTWNRVITQLESVYQRVVEDKHKKKLNGGIG